MATISDEQVLMAMEAADEAGVRLEIIAGVPTWEAFPGFRHQTAIQRISSSIVRPESDPECECVHASDVLIRFPDGSLKRPDIAIFCRIPDELDTAITLIPEAVVEVISLGYEYKDWNLGLPFYLAHGVRDVVLFDPRMSTIYHATRTGNRNLLAPQTITFECGCSCRIEV